MSNKPNPNRAASHSAARPEPKSTRSATPFIIGGIVLIVAIVAVLVAVLAGGDDKSADEPVATVDAGLVVDCPESAAVDLEAVDPDPFEVDSVVQPVAVAGDPVSPYSDEISSGAAADPAICQPVPLVSGYTYDGDPITIDPARDGPTLIVLLAHWCPHCNAEVPVLNEWRESGDVPDGLSVVGVSTAVTEGRDHYPPNEWLTELDWQWPALADDANGTAFNAFGGRFFPTLMFVGSDGLVRWRVTGEYPIDAVQQLVDAGMASEPDAVSPSTSA